MTAVNFSGSAAGNSSLTAPDMFLVGGLAVQNWRLSGNASVGGRLLQHLAASVWSSKGTFKVADLAGLRDALNRGDFSSGACSYPPTWSLQQTGSGATLKHGATTVMTGLESDLTSLQDMLNLAGLS